MRQAPEVRLLEVLLPALDGEAVEPDEDQLRVERRVLFRRQVFGVVCFGRKNFGVGQLKKDSVIFC